MNNRNELESRILSECKKRITEPRIKKLEMQKRLLDDFNIPMEMSNDVLSLRETILSRYDGIVLYAFSKEFGINTEFFTQEEISCYDEMKYSNESLTYPLKLDAVKITPIQYVCCIKIIDLINMFKTNKIKYNTDAQRAVKRVSFNGIEYVTFDVNTKSVEEIAHLLIENKFVKNTITLRSNSIILYDPKKKEITINSNGDFDIIDGYHRLQGMVAAYQLSPSSIEDETFEVRIVDFDDAVVERFIKQENKRNKISVVNERTLKLKDGSTDIYDKLRMSSELSIIFQKKDKIIDKSIACMAISGIYFKHDEIKKSLEELDSIYREIKTRLLNYINCDMSYFKEPLNVRQILCLFASIYLGFSFYDFKSVYEKSLDVPNLYPTYSEINRRTVTRILKFVEER